MERPRSLKQYVGPWKSSEIETGDEDGVTTSTRFSDVNLEYALSITAFSSASSISLAGRKRRRIAKASCEERGMRSEGGKRGDNDKATTLASPPYDSQALPPPLPHLLTSSKVIFIIS